MKTKANHGRPSTVMSGQHVLLCALIGVQLLAAGCHPECEERSLQASDAWDTYSLFLTRAALGSVEEANAHANEAALLVYSLGAEDTEVVALNRQRDRDRINTLAYQARRGQAISISRAFADGEVKRAVQAATSVPEPPSDDEAAYRIARQAALRAAQACF